MPGEQGVRRRGRRPAQLGRYVVVAAGGGEHHGGVPVDRPGQGVIGGGVAGVQSQNDVRRLRQGRRGDVALHERHRPRDRQRLRDGGVVLVGLRLHVHADHVHVEPADLGQVAVAGERQVRVAAAEVDDTQAGHPGSGCAAALTPARRRRTAASVRRNSSTWRYFACRLGLIRPCSSEMPMARSTGSSSGSSRGFFRSWLRTSGAAASLLTGGACAPSPRASW